MTYRKRIVTPLTHLLSGNPDVPTPWRFNGVKYTVANNTLAVVSGILYASPMLIPAGASFDEIGVKVFADETIDTSSIDNPTVITTLTPHPFSTSDSVEIAGHTGSTPDINGIHTITVTGSTTFTIPVDVTVGGTGGTVQLQGVAARMGLYNNDEVHGGPGSLLAELGRFTTHSAGFNSMAIDVVTVQETALYWLVLLGEDTVTYDAFRGGGLFTSGPTSGGVSNFMGWGYRTTGQGTTLPDPILHTDLTTWEEGPHIVMRCNNVPSMTMPMKRARRPLRHQPKEGEDQMQHLRITDGVGLDTPGFAGNKKYLVPLILQMPIKVVDTNVTFYEPRPDNLPGRLLGKVAELGPGFYWAGLTVDVANSGFRPLGDTLFSLNGGNYPSAAFSVITATLSDPFDLSLARTDEAVVPLFKLAYEAIERSPPTSLRRFAPCWPHVYAPDFWVGPCAADWTVGADKILFTNNSWAQLWIVDRPTTYDQVSLEFPGFGTAPVNIRWGIYDDKGYRPGSLMRHLTASTAIITTGRVDTAIVGDLTLMPGTYWLAVDCDDVGNNVVQGILPARSMDVRGGVQDLPYMHFKSGAPMPDVWPRGTNPDPQSPALWMRIKNHA